MHGIAHQNHLNIFQTYICAALTAQGGPTPFSLLPNPHRKAMPFLTYLPCGTYDYYNTIQYNLD